MVTPYSFYRGYMTLKENKYAIPKIGPLLYDYDRVKDSARKDADFRRNTGRDYYYRTDSNTARAQRDLSYDFEFMSPTASFGTKTFKWFI